MTTTGRPTTAPPTASAWSNRNFRRLWTASAASKFGAEIAEIAMPLLALLTLSASAAELGGLRVAQFLPFLLATLPLGVLVDRHRRRRLALMIGADVGRFLLIAAIPVTVWLGLLGMPLLYVLVFTAGVLTVLYAMADFAFLPSIVAREQLVDANGKIVATESASQIGGRGLGGLLISATSPPLAVGVNAFGFLVSALSLCRIRTEAAGEAENHDSDQAATGSSSAWGEMREGLRATLHNRYVRALVGEATTFNFFNEMYVLGLLLYVVQDLELGAATIGLIFTAGGIGSFLGAWFGSRFTGRFGYGRVLVLTLIIGNGAPVATAFAGSAGDAVLLLLCVVFAVTGIGSGVADVHAISLRQAAVAEQLRGRVNAAYRVISWGAIPAGAAAGGLLAGALGGRTTTLIGAVGVSLSTLWVVFSAVPRLARVEDAQPSGTADS